MTYEMRETHEGRKGDDGSPGRGCLIGLLLCLPLWAAAIALLGRVLR